MKRLLTICVFLLSLAMVIPTASAASRHDCLTIAAAVCEKDLATAAPAVMINIDGNCTVYSDISVYDSNADYYMVLLGEDAAEISFLENDENGLTIFHADDSLLSDPHVLNVAQNIQAGEELIFYFYIIDSQDNLSVQKGTAMVDQGSTIHTKLPNGVDESDVLFPSVVLNQAGELAIIRTGQGYLPVCDVETGGTSAPPSQDPDPKPGSGIDIKIVVAVAAVVVAAVVFLLRHRRLPNPPVPAPTAPPTPSIPVPPVPDIEINPVVIKPQPQPQPQPRSSVLYLCCEGGVMDGRRYPVGTTTLLIGRNPECNICYPSDTKGVSRRHCEIFWKNGVLHIMDLGSASGTFIRGKGQITANIPIAINAGDTFYLGEKRNAFVIRMEG